MKVLVFSQHYWPETFRITEVVQSLNESGVDVSVLAGQPNYPEGKIFPGYGAMTLKKESKGEVLIYRVPVIPRGGGSAIRLFLNYFSFVFFATVFGPWLLRGKKVDVILVYAPSPILQVIPAIVLAKIKKAKIVTWVQDLWPESLEATGFVRNSKILGIVASVVRWIYRGNDLLLVQSEAFIEPVAKKAGGTPVMFHPNPGETSFSAPITNHQSSISLEPGFNVVFAGNLGTAQALGTIIDAAQILEPHSEIKIFLFGSGSRKKTTELAILKLNLKNVILPGRFPLSEMPGIFRQASALLVTLVKSPIMSLTVPSKVQAYLASGTPIVASLDGEGARIVNEAGAGVTCPAEDPNALAKIILELKNMPVEEREGMARNGKEYYRTHYEPKLLASRLGDILSSCVTSTRN